jgi:RNA polymerase sigma-70 factor (ECF subfamily)
MDRDLVERAQAGDHDAYTELARASIGRLYAIARLILRDGERAKDATQEALVAAWRELPSLREPERFEPWLRRLLVRACYREARRGQRRRVIESQVAALDAFDDPTLDVADRDELARGFERLTPEQRTLIVLHYYVGLPIAETADVLGIPAGTVKSRLHRATRRLRAALDADARLPLTQGRPA